MNEYVKEFSPQHGYHISIGRSSFKKKKQCKYICHRSGLPEIAKDSTKDSKSLKIGCPFTLKARYNSTNESWSLSHVNTNHNHPPNPVIRDEFIQAQSFKPPINTTVTISKPSTASHHDDDAAFVTKTLGRSGSQLTTLLNSPTCATSTLNPPPPVTSEPMIDSFVSKFGQQLRALPIENQRKLIDQINDLFMKFQNSESDTTITINTNGPNVSYKTDSDSHSFHIKLTSSNYMYMYSIPVVDKSREQSY